MPKQTIELHGANKDAPPNTLPEQILKYQATIEAEMEDIPRDERGEPILLRDKIRLNRVFYDFTGVGETSEATPGMPIGESKRSLNALLGRMTPIEGTEELDREGNPIAGRYLLYYHPIRIRQDLMIDRTLDGIDDSRSAECTDLAVINLAIQLIYRPAKLPPLPEIADITKELEFLRLTAEEMMDYCDQFNWDISELLDMIQTYRTRRRYDRREREMNGKK